MNQSITKYKTPLLILLLAAAIFAVYSNILHAPFVFDDRMYIVENGEIRGLSGLWPLSGTRYIAYLSFALNYSLGGLDPFGYHLVNIIIHIFNSILVYALVALTFRTPILKESAAARPNLPFFAGALSAFIFALHPVQTEVITYITQRFASLAALFYLLSLVLFIKWRLGHSDAKGGYGIYVLSLVSAIFAMKTKEISFTLPFVILFYDLAFFRVKPRERALSLLPFLLTLLIIPLTILFPGAAASGIDEKIRRAQLDELLNFSRYEYLLTQFRVITTYIRLTLLPAGQNLIYDYRVSRSIFEPAVIASFIFLFSLSLPFSRLCLFALPQGRERVRHARRRGCALVLHSPIDRIIHHPHKGCHLRAQALLAACRRGVINFRHFSFYRRLLPEEGGGRIKGYALNRAHDCSRARRCRLFKEPPLERACEALRGYRLQEPGEGERALRPRQAL